MLLESARGGSPGADTLGAGVSPSHSAPGVWLPGCSLSWSGSASQPAGAELARQAGGEPVDVMFLPRNGKGGMFLGEKQGSGASAPGNVCSPGPPGASCPALGPAGRRMCSTGGQACPGHRVYRLTRSQIPHSLTTHSDTHSLTHEHSQKLIHTSTPTWPHAHLYSLAHE